MMVKKRFVKLASSPLWSINHFFGMLSDGDFIKREQGQVPSLFNAFIFFALQQLLRTFCFDSS
jgi:hypothetical protein